MRTRTIRPAAITVLLLAALTACSGPGHADGPGSDEKPAAAKSSSPKAKPSVDCSDQNLDQATWMEHCSDKAGTGGDGTDGQTTGLTFDDTYTWPDGLKVTVIEAKVFTDYDKELMESPTPGSTDFRIKLKLTNTGKAAIDLSKLSTIVEGSTNGGEAASTSFENGSEPLEGRLAPGLTVTKTDDSELESKYGRKIVVTVQRASDDLSFEFPEFNGVITG